MITAMANTYWQWQRLACAILMRKWGDKVDTSGFTLAGCRFHSPPLACPGTDRSGLGGDRRQLVHRRAGWRTGVSADHVRLSLVGGKPGDLVSRLQRRRRAKIPALCQRRFISGDRVVDHIAAQYQRYGTGDVVRHRLHHRRRFADCLGDDCAFSALAHGAGRRGRADIDRDLLFSTVSDALQGHRALLPRPWSDLQRLEHDLAGESLAPFAAYNIVVAIVAQQCRYRPSS